MSDERTLTEQDLDRYTISSPAEILSVLDFLIGRGEPMTVLFNHGAESFLSMLLDFDEEANQLIFDWGGSEEVNRRFLQAGSGSFLCRPDGIRVQFPAESVRAGEYGDRRAFVSALPRSLLRLQRREYFRINLPVGRRPMCELELGNGGIAHLPVHGLSVAGLSFVEEPAAFAGLGQLVRIPRCRFQLGEYGDVECGLEVRYVTELSNRAGRVLSRMGCRFVDIPPNMQAHIQRYMIHLESERRSKEPDWE